MSRHRRAVHRSMRLRLDAEAAPLYKRYQTVRRGERSSPFAPKFVHNSRYPGRVFEQLFLRLVFGVLALSAHQSRLPLAFQGKYAEADPLSLRAVEIGKKTLGPDHPELARLLNSRAEVLREQVRMFRKRKCVQKFFRRPIAVADAQQPRRVVDGAGGS